MHGALKRTWLLIPTLAMAAVAAAEFTGGLTRLALDEPRTIDGIPCTNEALLFPDGRLEGCLLARDAVIAGHEFPAGSWPYFDPPGVLKCVFLAHDHEVQGYLLRGDGNDYQTCFHPNGWLRFGNLRDATVIQGVPCGKSTFWTWILKGPSGVYFHDNGRLKACRLSRDVNQLRKHQRIEIDREGNIVNLKRRAEKKER
jgi:hypothetical protein